MKISLKKKDLGKLKRTTVYMSLIPITDQFTDAVFLSYLVRVDLSLERKRPPGSEFWRQEETILRDIGLTSGGLRGCKRRLVGAGLISISRHGWKGRLNFTISDKVYAVLQNELFPELENDTPLQGERYDLQGESYDLQDAHLTIEQKKSSCRAKEMANPSGCLSGGLPSRKKSRKEATPGETKEIRKGRVTILKHSSHSLREKGNLPEGKNQHILKPRTTKEVAEKYWTVTEDSLDTPTLEEIVSEYREMKVTPENLLRFWRRGLYLLHAQKPPMMELAKHKGMMATVIRVAGKERVVEALRRVLEDWDGFSQACVDNGYISKPKIPRLEVVCAMAGILPTFIEKPYLKEGELEGWGTGKL